jgi:hypothetical protein
VPAFSLTVKVTVWPTVGFLFEAVIVVVVEVAAVTVETAAIEETTESVTIKAIKMAVDCMRLFKVSYPPLPVSSNTVARL